MSYGAAPPDAGPAVEAPMCPPAGAPAALAVVPCPGTPPLLWSRTFLDVDVDFRGAADDAGNLFWVEYDPPRNAMNRDGPAFLVSADADGVTRWRVPTTASPEGAFMLSNGRVLVSSTGFDLSAHDAATGARAWRQTLGDTARSSDQIREMTDLGGGKIAFAFSGSRAGVIVVDVATGATDWSSDASAGSVAGSDGAGSLLVVRWAPPTNDPWHPNVDFAALDSAGREQWKERVPNAAYAPGFVSWSAARPSLSITGNAGLCAHGQIDALPGLWFRAVAREDVAFGIAFGATGQSPDTVEVVRDGAVIASAPFPQTSAYNGFGVFPFLAGEGDHVALVGQVWRSQPAMCHPERAGEAFFARVDATSMYQCALAFDGESGIEGAALLPGRLVIGRRTYLTSACTQQLQPVTIEAYALPGESLAASGWVQREGSPGLGRRPLRR